MDYQHLSTLLWREQELLDLLLFKAEEKQYLILTGKTRWLARIAHEIEVVLDQLRTLEVERAAATEADRRPARASAPTRRCARSPRPPPRRGTTCSPSTTRRCSSWSPTCAACRRQPRADRGRPGRDRRRAAVGRRRRRPAPTARPAATPTTARTAPSRWTAPCEHLLGPQRGDDRALGAAARAGRHRPEHRQRQHRGLLPPAGRPAGHRRQRRAGVLLHQPGIGAGVSADDGHPHPRRLPGGPRAHRARQQRPADRVEADAYELVEQAFREPGDTGIQSLLADMWSGWEDVANHPKDRRPRAARCSSGSRPSSAACTSATRSLGAQWDQTRENLGVLVDGRQRRGAARSPSSTRRSSGATQSGLPANDLADKRDVLVMKLADQVGATVRPREDGVVDVIVGGMTPRRRQHARPSSRSPAPIDPDLIAATDPPRIVTAAGGYTVARRRNRRWPAERAQHDHPLLPRRSWTAIAADLADQRSTPRTTTGFDRDGQPRRPTLLGSSTAARSPRDTIRSLITDPAADRGLVRRRRTGGSRRWTTATPTRSPQLRQVADRRPTPATAR